MSSKVKSARAIFEQRIEKNLERGEPQSRDFLSVVGRTSSARPRNILATPKPRAKPKVGQGDNASAPFLPSLDNGPTRTSSGESLARILGNDDSENDLMSDDEDPRLLEYLQAFDQSLRMANAKKLRSPNRRGSLVQEVFEDLDTSLVTASSIHSQVHQHETPKTVLTLKPSSSTSRGQQHRSHDGTLSPGAATSETCSMTSYSETLGSLESASLGKSNKKHLLKSYGFKRPPSPTSSNNSTVSKSSCGSTRSNSKAVGSGIPTSASPLVAPSPAKLEQHSQVRNSVLQGLRSVPLLCHDETKQQSSAVPLVETPSSWQAATLLEVESSEEAEDFVINSPTGNPLPITAKPILQIDQNGFPIQDAEEECDSTPPSPVKSLYPSLSNATRTRSDFSSAEIHNNNDESSDSRSASPILSLQPPREGVGSNDEVHFGFGPMSPQRQQSKQQRSFDLGFGAGYTTPQPQPLASPAHSCCSSGEFMDMQASMVSMENEDKEEANECMEDESDLAIRIREAVSSPSGGEISAGTSTGDSEDEFIVDRDNSKTNDAFYEEETEAPIDYGYERTSYRIPAAEPTTLRTSQSMRRDLSPHESLERGGRQSLSTATSFRFAKKQTRHLSMLGSSTHSCGSNRNQTRRISMAGTHAIEARRMSNPFIAEQFRASKQLMRSRVTPLELNMKKTMIVARGMARRRGTLLHDIGAHRRNSTTAPEELPHQINDKIKFSLRDLWKRRKRSKAEQKRIDEKANKMFPAKQKIVARRASYTITSQAPKTSPSLERRRRSMSTIQVEARVRFAFLEEFSTLAEKVHCVAATRIQARVRAFLQQSHYRIHRLERRLARIDYERIQEICIISKKTKARKKAHKKKTQKALADLAEQAARARKLTDHLKRENVKIKDQNQRLQQLSFKMRKINMHMEKTLTTHNKNFRSMWEFVEKMKNKKKRIQGKVKRYESRIENHTKHIEVVQKRIDSEAVHKNILVETLQRVATTVAVKSSNEKLRVLVEMVADGQPMDEELLELIGDDEDDIDDAEYDLHKSYDHDMLCETFHKSFVMDVMMDDDEESTDEGFLLALSNDDNSTISDVSSVYSDMEDTSFTEDGIKFDEDTAVHEKIVATDDEDCGMRLQQKMVENGEEEIFEEIIEEVLSDDEYIIEEVSVSSDEDGEDDNEDDLSCESSVWVDQGSIIM